MRLFGCQSNRRGPVWSSLGASETRPNERFQFGSQRQPDLYAQRDALLTRCLHFITTLHPQRHSHPRKPRFLFCKVSIASARSPSSIKSCAKASVSAEWSAQQRSCELTADGGLADSRLPTAAVRRFSLPTIISITSTPFWRLLCVKAVVSRRLGVELVESADLPLAAPLAGMPGSHDPFMRSVSRLSF